MVTAKSLFSKKVYGDYYWHDQLASGKIVPVILGMLVLAGIGIFYITAARTTYAIVMFALAIVLALSYVARVVTMINRNSAALKIDKTPYSVLVEVTDKKIHSLDSRTGKHVTFKWADIRKVCETGKYFYFHLNKKQAIVLCKADISEGSPEDIQKWAMQAKVARKTAKKK